MKRLLLTLLALLVLLGSLAVPSRVLATGIVLDSHLQQSLSQILPTGPLSVVLTYDHQPTAADVTAAQATGLLVSRFSFLPMLAVHGTSAQVRAALNLPGLRSAFQDRPLQFLTTAHVAYTGADRAWQDYGVTGQGVTVAVVDSGIDGTHPDLQQRVRKNMKVVAPFGVSGTGVDPVYLDLPNTDTSSGHGTHVAGIIAGDGATSSQFYTGVAPGASLIGLGTGEAISILYALEAFDWVGAHGAENGVRVVSNSWGTTGAYDPADPVNVASKALHDAGFVVTFAAGNDGPGPNTLNPYSVAPWVIGVAAGDLNGQLASFSSRGVAGDSLLHPTVTAPGVSVPSTRATTGTTLNLLDLQGDVNCVRTDLLASYTCASGTSMATPHISGVVALLLQASPGLTPDQVKQTLTQTATPMTRPDGSSYAEWEVGAGYVDAHAAVQSVR